MRRNTKIKLSKKTKKQMYDYLNIRRNDCFESAMKYKEGTYFYNFYLNEYEFINDLMLDIEFYG